MPMRSAVNWNASFGQRMWNFLTRSSLKSMRRPSSRLEKKKKRKTAARQIGYANSVQNGCFSEQRQTRGQIELELGWGSGGRIGTRSPLQLLTTLSKGRQRGPSSEHFFWSNWKLSSVVVAAACSCTLDLLIVSVRCVAVSLASPNVSCSPSQSWLIAVEKLAQAPTTMLMMTAATTNSFHIFCCPTILLLVLGRNALFFHLQSKYTHIF